MIQSVGWDHGKELSQDRKEGPAQDRREGQTLPLRQVPQAKPEAREDACPLVLPGLRKRERRGARDSSGLIANGTSRAYGRTRRSRVKGFV